MYHHVPFESIRTHSNPFNVKDAERCQPSQKKVKGPRHLQTGLLVAVFRSSAKGLVASLQRQLGVRTLRLSDRMRLSDVLPELCTRDVAEPYSLAQVCVFPSMLHQDPKSQAVTPCRMLVATCVERAPLALWCLVGLLLGVPDIS